MELRYFLPIAQSSIFESKDLFLVHGTFSCTVIRCRNMFDIDEPT